MAQWFDLPTFTDTRGSLTVLEKVLPFEIRRAYWIYATDNAQRGGHRHLQTQQALVCLQGQVQLNIVRDKVNEHYQLNAPHQCLLVAPQDWHSMVFSHDAILLVLASHEYDASDYVTEP
jgi:dTDP-4-dehydrorhamnose 3,5-epimerase-like enzyme